MCEELLIYNGFHANWGNCTRYRFICIVIRRSLFTARAHMHKSIFTKTDVFHKYTERNNRWVTADWAWTEGRQEDGTGGDEEEEKWSEKVKADWNQTSADVCEREEEEGAYSFTHELSGGMRARRR